MRRFQQLKTAAIIGLAAAAFPAAVFAELAKGATFRAAGTVTAADTGESLAGVSVVALDTTTQTAIANTTTNLAGAYELSLAAGNYVIRGSLSAYRDGFVDDGRAIDLSEDKLSLDIELERAVGRILGVVTDADTGLPIPGVRVDVFDVNGIRLPKSDETNSSRGEYRLRDLPIGEYYLVAHASDRGFVDAIFFGGGEPVPCHRNRCKADLALGTLITVEDGVDAMGIDFALSGGALNAGDDDSDEDDQLGASVSQCGARVIVGAPGDDDAGVDAGAVYVFRRQGGGLLEVQKVLPEPTGADPSGGRFGSAVDCDGATFVVGAPADGVIAKGNPALDKAAYIYQMTGTNISLIQELVQNNLMVLGEGFASAVAIDGTTIAIGAPAAQGAGAVAILDAEPGGADPWALQTMLSDPEAQPGSQFGQAVSLSDGMIAIGAPGQAGPGGLATGVAAIYERISGTRDWSQIGKFSNGGMGGDAFGSSIAMTGGMVAVGAPARNAAYVFEIDAGITQLVDLAPPGLMPSARFGASVSLTHQRLVVGAPGSDQAALNGGAVFAYDLADDFALTDEMTSQRAGQQNAYGTAVEAMPGSIVIGSPHAAIAGVRSGSVEARVEGALFVGTFE